MKMLLLVSTTAVVAVFHVLSSSSATDVHTTQSTLNTTELPANYSKVTCGFNESMCGWTNVGGSNYSLTWQRDTDDADMYLEMDGDAKGRLASPWLDPLENHRCQLKFLYQLNSWRSNKCQLTLLRQTASGQEDVITVLASDTGSSSETTEPVNCTGERFRLVFEGWESCGKWHPLSDGTIELDDIVFTTTCIQPTPQTSEGTGTTPVTTGQRCTGSVIPSSNSHVTATSAVVTSSMETISDHGLDSGSLAGIIIAVIIVIVVVVIIVVMVMLRRGRNKGKVVSPRQIVSPNRVNAAFTASTDDLRTAGILGVIGGTPSGGEAEEDNYEIADLPPPSTVPTHPSNNATHSDDNDRARPHQPHHPPSMKGASHESDVYMNVGQPSRDVSTTNNAANNDNDDTDGVYDLTWAASSVAAPEDTYDHTSRRPLEASSEKYDHTNQQPLPSVTSDNDEDSYNHLGLNTGPQSGATSPYEDTYDHTRVQHQHPQPISDDFAEPHAKTNTKPQPKFNNSTTTTSSEESAALSTEGGTTDYELARVVREKVRSSPPTADADDAYNLLDVRGERSEEGLVGENVYDHAKGDNYDSLHEESRKRREQRQLAQDDYSHIE